MSPSLLLIVLIALSFGIGLMILLASGITRVRADQAIVIEKAGSFYRTHGPGFIYLLPFVFRVVGRYGTRLQEATARFNSFSLVISYRIVDVEKYHYAGHCFLLRLEEKLAAIDAPETVDINTLILEIAAEFAVEVEAFELLKLANSN